MNIIIDNKNTLSLSLGYFLKKERKRLNSSTIDFASKLDLGHSFYRMIESGSANLNPTKSFNLISALDDRKINIDKLSKFLLGVQYVESIFKKGNSETVMQSLLALYEKNDEDFVNLLNTIIPVFDISDDKKVKEYFDDNIYNSILNFLTNNYYNEISESDFVDEKILNLIGSIPSLTLEIVLDFIKVLGQHPPMHILGLAEKWEKDNAHNFESLLGIYKNPKLIIHEDNISRFNYKYLYDSSFSQLTLIFYKNEEDTKPLELEFIELVEKYNGKKLSKYQKSRINFIWINNSSTKHKIDSILNTKYENPDTSDSLEAFWAFKMKSGNQIGFVGVRENDTDKIWNLTTKEVGNKLNLLKKIMND
jgi:transcriptional regulator with XRE-family HTH domain